MQEMRLTEFILRKKRPGEKEFKNIFGLGCTEGLTEDQEDEIEQILEKTAKEANTTGINIEYQIVITAKGENSTWLTD